MMRKPRVEQMSGGCWHVTRSGAVDVRRCFRSWRAAMDAALAKVRRAEVPC